jgi:hypothetical protein
MKISWLLLAIFFYAAASLLGNDELEERLQPALEAITPDGLLAHIKVLASDEFEGRAPGSKGEDLSVKYITDQFKKIGLKPGNPDGTYTQEVPLAGIKSEPRMSFVIGDKTMDPKYPDDFVASSARLHPEIKIEKSGLVFVGYGVVAGVRLERLQKCRCEGQDVADADRRSADSRSKRSVKARRQNVQRKSDDVLRPLDLQV